MSEAPKSSVSEAGTGKMASSVEETAAAGTSGITVSMEEAPQLDESVVSIEPEVTLEEYVTDLMKDQERNELEVMVRSKVKRRGIVMKYSFIYRLYSVEVTKTIVPIQR